MSQFVVILLFGAVVGIQVEKPRGNPYEKYRGVPKGGVIKGTCMYSYQGCKNPVFYSKYIIIK